VPAFYYYALAASALFLVPALLGLLAPSYLPKISGSTVTIDDQGVVFAHWWSVALWGVSSLYCFAAVALTKSQQKLLNVYLIPWHLLSVWVAANTGRILGSPALAYLPLAQTVATILFAVAMDAEEDQAISKAGSNVPRYFIYFMAVYLLTSSATVHLNPQGFLDGWGTGWKSISASTQALMAWYGTAAGGLVSFFVFAGFHLSAVQQKRFLLFNFLWFVIGCGVAVYHRNVTLAPAVVVPLLTAALAVSWHQGTEGTADGHKTKAH